MDPAASSIARRRSSRRYVIALLLIAGSMATFVLMPMVDDDYTVRSQVSEGRSLSFGAQTAVEEFFAKHHAYPVDNEQSGLPRPTSINGTYVVSLTVEKGTIVVIYGNHANPEIAGKALVVRPHVVGESLVWSCKTTDGTTVPVKELPTICRP